GLEQVQYRPKNRQIGQSELAAFCFQPLDQVLLEQRVKNDTGRFFDVRQDPVELLLGANQRMNVLDRHDLRILRGSGPRDRNQRLTGGVGDHMKVKIAGRLRHGIDRSEVDNLSMTREKAMADRGVQAPWRDKSIIHPHPCRAGTTSSSPLWAVVKCGRVLQGCPYSARNASE